MRKTYRIEFYGGPVNIQETVILTIAVQSDTEPDSTFFTYIHGWVDEHFPGRAYNVFLSKYPVTVDL